MALPLSNTMATASLLHMEKVAKGRMRLRGVGVRPPHAFRVNSQ